MFQMASAQITGFWGTGTASVDFFPDVNVFIGKNGSGKTTFIELLQGALRADLRALSSYEFDEIVIRLSTATHKRTLRVTRERREEPVDLLRYQLGTKVWRLPLYSPEMDTGRHYGARPRLLAILAEIKEELAALVSVASVSVHRADLEPVSESEYPPRRRAVRPPIDERLESLLRALTAYQLVLAERANALSSDFQRQVLASILYDKRFDSFTKSDLSKIDLEQSRDQVTRAYKEMGALTKALEQRIAAHFEAINHAVTAFQTRRGEDGRSSATIADLLALPLARRSTHIAQLLSGTETKKQIVFRPREAYLEALRQFLQDKKVDVGVDGELTVERSGRSIGVPSLSSGEKQILILLTETLLQQGRPFIMIADEPELSLHIDWQSGVIDAIRRLNARSQVVVATHSPEIAAGWQGRLIDMASVVNG